MQAALSPVVSSRMCGARPSCIRRAAAAPSAPRCSPLRSAAATRDLLSAGARSDPLQLSPEELFSRAREFIDTGSGYFSPARPELLSDAFVFRGPIVGPLCKKDYLATLGGFKLYDTFPDLQSNAYGFCIDPFEPMRVRFFIRQIGTCTGSVHLLAPLMEIPPTNKRSVVATEAYSILFDSEGKVKLLNVGYCVDFDEPGANAGKLSAAIGLLAGAGIELPMGKVFSSLQWISTRLQNAGLLKEAGRGVSNWEDVPQWYKEYCPRRDGAEGAPSH